MLEQTKLKNGLQVVTKNDSYSKTVTLSYLVRCGSYHETEEILGIAHFTEHMLFKGTTNRNSSEISYAIEGVGGIINAETSHEYTKYHCTVPANKWEIGLEVLSDMIWNNTIPEEEFIKEKQVVIEELKMYDDDPGSRTMELLFTNIFNEYKNRQTIGGKVATVKNITRNNMIEFIDKFYVPDNIILIATGNVNHNDIIKFFENYNLLEIESNFINNNAKVDFNKIKSNAKELTEIKEIEQAHMSWGILGPEPTDNDFIVLDIICNLLGGNSSSRLYQLIREQHGLAYVVDMSINDFSDSSIAVGYVISDKENINTVKEMVLDEIDKIKNEIISLEELQRVKEYIKGTNLIWLETTSNNNKFLCSSLITNTSLNIEDYFDKIDSTTPEKIIEVANKYLHKDNIYFSKVLPKNV